MMRNVYLDDVLTEQWDDEARIYTAYNPDGSVAETRPYTSEENARIDGQVVAATQASNKSTIEVNLEADLATMQAIKDTDNAVIRDNPAPYIKDLATAVRRLIKMELEDFEQAE